MCTTRNTAKMQHSVGWTVKFKTQMGVDSCGSAVINSRVGVGSCNLQDTMRTCVYLCIYMHSAADLLC